MEQNKGEVCSTYETKCKPTTQSWGDSTKETQIDVTTLDIVITIP